MKKKLKKKRWLIYLFLFFIGIIIGYKYIEKKRVVLHNREIVDFVLNNSFQTNNFFQQLEVYYFKKNRVFSLLNEDYKEVTTLTKNDIYEPIVYLYNSHPTEEYAISTFGEYSLDPRVTINNYIIEDILEKNGYLTYVEERSVSNILDENNWNYASSYIASRIFLEDSIEKYPSLKYFVDIHRDSLDKDRTTITIDGRNYAKLLFIIGLENDNYEENLAFTEKIVSKLDIYYPGLCKGIYKKEGPGVNGVYNQDFSPYTILIEIGGYQNTTTEVLNSSIAFSKSMIEVLNEENS